MEDTCLIYILEWLHFTDPPRGEHGAVPPCSLAGSFRLAGCRAMLAAYVESSLALVMEMTMFMQSWAVSGGCHQLSQSGTDRAVEADVRVDVLERASGRCQPCEMSIGTNRPIARREQPCYGPSLGSFSPGLGPCAPALVLSLPSLTRLL